VEKVNVSKKRHILKTITWRLIGTIDTMLLGWFVTGSPTIGLKISSIELLTKMFLYYFHERAWYRFNFGINNRKKLKNEEGDS
tara:strand:- start:526 stop:774 length:249 start_codon:yes stop_codon:yes gene_type:complete